MFLTVKVKFNMLLFISQGHKTLKWEIDARLFSTLVYEKRNNKVHNNKREKSISNKGKFKNSFDWVCDSGNTS